MGGALGLHGHGLRTRQVRGPLTPDAAATLVTVTLRRYRCRHCAAVVTVAPRELRAGRLFTATAIALALALWAAHGASARQVRARVSPWRTVGAAAARGWCQLRRWATAAAGLFPTLRLAADAATPRACAGRVVAVLLGLTPPAQRTGAASARAFWGAAQPR